MKILLAGGFVVVIPVLFCTPHPPRSQTLLVCPSPVFYLRHIVTTACVWIPFVLRLSFAQSERKTRHTDCVFLSVSFKLLFLRCSEQSLCFWPVSQPADSVTSATLDLFLHLRPWALDSASVFVKPQLCLIFTEYSGRNWQKGTNVCYKTLEGK